MKVSEAILAAECILPNPAAPDGEVDPRWQAIITVGEFVESHPEEVWRFVAKSGISSDPDLQSAIATCVLEHLLEFHFDTVFPRVQALAKADRNFAATFLRCWKFGEANLRENSERFDALAADCGRAGR